MKTYKKEIKRFRYHVYDKKAAKMARHRGPNFNHTEDYGPISYGEIEATSKTAAIAAIKEQVRENHDLPFGRAARDCGYVPLSDWEFRFEVYTSRGWVWIG